MINLVTLKGNFSIIQLDSKQEIPSEIFLHDFFSVTRTKDEISIIVNKKTTIPSARYSDGWKGFMVEGILDFSLVGIINDITCPLKENGISVFVTSTFNTDYIFVKESSFEKTLEVFGKTDYIKLIQTNDH
jgi:uncharacterized protein